MQNQIRRMKMLRKFICKVTHYDLGKDSVEREHIVYMPQSEYDTSGARYRNERGIDCGFKNNGLDMAVEMIKEICGGEISNIKSVGKPLNRQEKINFNLDEVSRLLGVSFKKSDINQILTGLGFSLLEKNNKIEITIPSWRMPALLKKSCVSRELTI